MSRFFLILFVLVVYTGFKASQMWPNHRYIATLTMLPVFGLMIGWMFIQRYHPTLVNVAWFEALALIGSIIMGIWATFIIFSIPADLIQLAVVGFQKITKSTYDEQRRSFIFNNVRFSILAASGAIGGMGLIQTWLGPKVKKVNIQSSSLPVELKNLRIAQISDLHVGATIRSGYVNEIVEKTNALNPDLIFITGDLADGRVVDLKHLLDPLSKLKAKHGVYYVVGNHEFYWGMDDYASLMKSYGFVPLMNENKSIQIGDATLCIVGITDPAAIMTPHGPSLSKAMAGVDAKNFKILLAHRPDTIIEAEPLGIDLQFSGHTHSGQFFPFNLLVPLAHKYYHGLNTHGRAQVYVNPGTGYWGPPNRFGVSSEITDITLI